jgi:catalase
MSRTAGDLESTTMTLAAAIRSSFPIPWSDTNTTNDLGTIAITAVVPDSDATQRALLFVPSLLPDGIEPADPMVRFRGLAYPVPYDRRHP